MRQVVRILIVAALLTLIPVNPGSAGQRINLTLLISTGFSPAAREQITALLQDYERETGVHIELQPVDNTLLGERVMLGKAAGVPPDMARVGWEFVASLAAVNALEPIDHLVQAVGIPLDQIEPEALKAMTYRGRMYGLPVTISTELSIFNRDLYDQGGVAYPAQDWTDPAYDWEVLVANARKLTIDTNGDGLADQYGIGSMGTQYSWAFYRGGRWFDESVTRFTGDSPEVIAGVEQVVALYLESRVAAGSDAGQRLGGGWLFANGKVALDISHTGRFAAAQEAGVNWDFAVHAAGPERHPVMYPNGIIVVKDANAEESMRFLQWLLRPENHRRWITAEGALPPTRPGTELAFWSMERYETLFPGVNAFTTAQALSFAWVPRVWSHVKQGEVYRVIHPIFNQIISGQKSVAAAIAEIKPAVEAINETVR